MLKRLRSMSLGRALPVSFAGIALLTAVALGMILLVSLRSFYGQREREYLEQQAQSVSLVAAAALESGISIEALESQLDLLSLLTQTKIRLFDPQRNVLAETSVPGPSPDSSQLTSLLGDTSGMVLIQVGEEEGATVRANEGSLQDLLSQVQLGYGLDAIAGESGDRSSKVAELPIRDSSDNLLGFAEISQGPAYGRQTVSSVTVGWVIAGSVAVVFAALVGLFISRSLSEPLVDLSRVTAEMADGKLSVRAEARQQNEIGVLASSFNRMADSVEETIGDLRRFVADAAHELKTPVTALRTNLDVARASAEGEGASGDSLDKAQNQVIRLQGLIDSMLDLHRFETQTSEMDSQAHDIRTIVQSVGEDYASQAEQKGVTYRQDLPDIAVSVVCDPLWLR